MRVLLCSHVYPPDGGGVAAFAYDLMLLLKNSGYEMRVLHELGEGSGACRFFAAFMHRHRRSRVGMPLRFLHFLCAVVAFRPQLVICSTWLHYGLPAVWFARFFGYKVVIQVHGSEVRGRFKQGYRHARMMRALHAADLLWPNSHFTQELLADYGCSPTKMQVIHPFLSAELLQAAQEHRHLPRDHPPLILTAAHLYPRKGVDLVLRALARLRDLEWQYVIAGAEARPGYRRFCQDLAQDLGIATRVRFLDRLPRADLWKLMARSTIFVMTSRPDPDDIESFGIVYIEAQAFGVVCAAARVGGVADAVGDAGALVPPEDPKALAAVLREWLTHPVAARRLGEHGRARVLASFTEKARREQIMPRLQSLFQD
ncbi:MAG: glycosyltransferase family 4 protein [Chloroflexi bacterium]|nr:glycosyltransferase family 4 protein [Chloroflexota bacterium]